MPLSKKAVQNIDRLDLFVYKMAEWGGRYLCMQDNFGEDPQGTSSDAGLEGEGLAASPFPFHVVEFFIVTICFFNNKKLLI